MRKIIQITSSMTYDPQQGPRIMLVALCEDGTLWKKWNSNSWVEVENVPQPGGIVE